MSVSGAIRPHDQLINKVSVIGGGDLGMASVMSILSKVITFCDVSGIVIDIEYYTSLNSNVIFLYSIADYIFFSYLRPV